ncbi:LOW QUALITY PROTEIN: FGGY carbohydrate kinase domain-containing protein-like [Amphiura filiformis]|uniref:LOW QUALITY PROTEIN: FGGY carbohydrate kinase domain-containing protein-like n=1 Tax=Amphiura filiformis TaxID=82378 RepID=UPI003B2163A6
MAATDADIVPEDLFVGVDVGTGSVRAALVDAKGTILKTCQHVIKIFEPQPGYYEQSSDNIWEACRTAVKGAVGDINPEKVKGVGFDATCSLVVLDDKFQSITVSPTGCPTRNIIMWVDHRPETQTNSINATKHKVLKFVGGQMSVEMQPPKLLWLKQNMPNTWSKAGHFFDLADFMTWKATGATSRSLNTLVCKWAYQPNSEGARHWDDSFWQQIGLGDLIENNYAKIGSEVLKPGTPVGSGLTAEAAKEFGLCEGTAVGTGIIDCHAGGVGMLACNVEGFNLPCQDKPITSRLALICGTSSAHIAVNQDPLFVPGVWGPFYSVMHPELWTHEGGQSIGGKLIDHVIHTHPAFKELEERASKSGESVYETLNNMLPSIAALRRSSSPATLTKDLHMWPDYHGNRSPLADPTLKGMISGLTLSTSIEDLAIKYLATVQALAHGTKHVNDAMESSGHKFATLFACGGLSKNSLFLQVHADITGLPIVLPKETECVLVGSAILGAAAAGHYTNVQVMLISSNDAVY